jgi:hypothetical protein
VSEQHGFMTSEDAVTESWSTRWYMPLLALGVAALVLMILALAIVEVLVAEAPRVVAPGSWTTPLERADEALRDGDVRQALAWWREARSVALRSRQWEGLVEVGDASRRLGARGGFRPEGEAHARDAYMTALTRARRQHSLDGVLRVAIAFGELGDREVVAHAVRIAAHEAADDPRARERVRAVADRWMTRPREAPTPATIPGGL